MPLLWAEPGDAVLAPGESEFDPAEVDRCAPWGWSLDARRQFLNAGVSEAVLPSAEAIERMRMLSHRRSSVELLRLIGMEELAAREMTDPDEVVEAERQTPGLWLKSPWSCSGRGVFCASSLSAEALRSRAAGIIHRQGSVMAERGLKGKRLDFAALYTVAEGGAVGFEGWSVFRAEERGVYTGNLVAPQDRLLQTILDAGVDPRPLIGPLAEALATLIGNDYTGPLGIDMMAHAGGLHPCIELNLRRTMGHVALAVAPRTTAPSLLGWQLNSSVSREKCLISHPSGFSLTLTETSL